MKKLFFLSLVSWCVHWAVPLDAQNTMQPAMIIHGIDGSRQVVPLDHTSVTDFTVLCKANSLSFSIPEISKNGVLSITFGMVKVADNPTSVEDANESTNDATKKILLNGKLYIRTPMPNGSVVWYDALGQLIVDN